MFEPNFIFELNGTHFDKHTETDHSTYIDHTITCTVCLWTLNSKFQFKKQVEFNKDITERLERHSKIHLN